MEGLYTSSRTRRELSCPEEDNEDKNILIKHHFSACSDGPCVIGGTRNTSCTIWCLERKVFFDYIMFHDGWETIVTNGDLDNINNRVFKLPRLANFDLHKNLT